MKRSTGILLRSPRFWFIVAGYILRIIIMPVTGQHDVMFMPWMTRYINQGHLNLYAFLYEKYGNIVMQSPAIWAPYPYGFYLFTAGWLELLSKLSLVDLDTWQHVWEVSHPARLVFLFKLIYLPFDLGIGYILYKVCGYMGLALWAWSPLAIYTPFMMGQNDIYPTAFAVAGTYAASKAIQITRQNHSASSLLPGKWSVLTSIFLGIGSIFKIYPILLLPPLALIIEKHWWHRLILLGIGCSFLGLASLPFITTPTYIDGVLFNPEGSMIFREIRLFGTSVSPFLLSYLVLLVYLITADIPTNRQPHLAWFISLIVIAMLFLWVPTPLYWLVWMIPFLISVISKDSRLLLTWASLQFAFALLIVNEHRELGVALPIHLAEIFNPPNLPTALAITHPTLYRALITLLPLVRNLLIVALLVAIWYSARNLTQSSKSVEYHPRRRWWIVLPTVVLFSSLTVNLLLSRNLISRNNWYHWQPLTLSTGDYILQELSTERKEITGVRLKFTETTPSANLEVCVYRDGDINQEPLVCTSRNTNEAVEDKVLYFTFKKPVPLEDTRLVTKFQILGSNAKVTLPYTTSINNALLLNETKINGSLDISTLSSFKITEAFDKLVIENVLKDSWLLVTIVTTTTLVVLYLGILLSRSQTPTVY